MACCARNRSSRLCRAKWACRHNGRTGQLVSETRPGYAASYTYDGNGNRLTRTVNGVTEVFAYDPGDKLLSVSVGGQVVKSYGYDAAGRTTSVVSPAGTTTLTYDFEGRATSIVGPGISQTNVFNGLDTRVGSTTNSVTRSFLRDGAYVTDPVLRDGAAFYTPGISERRGAATTFLHSGLKNADAQSGPAQNLTASRAYDAFGNVLSSSGAWQGPFGYAGAFGYQEDATGLMLLGHRLYDPSTGRFLTRDPIKDGRNWYVYCENDPVNLVDPTGLISINTPHGRAKLVWLLIEEAKREGSGSIVGALLAHPSPKQGHHVFPESMRPWFAGRDIDIDKHIAMVPDWFHKYLHRGRTLSWLGRLLGRPVRGGWWNRRWENFRRQNPDASKDEMEAFLRELLRELAIPDIPIGPMG